MTNNKSLKFNLQLSIAESETIIDKLDIDFKIFKNNKPESNSAYLNIWNLNDTVFHELIEKENLIDVYAGFGEEEPGLMFRGYVELERTFNGRPPERVDCATVITLKDGKKAFEKFINKNYREKVTSTALIQDCISAMNIGLGSLSQNLPQTQFDNYKIYGYPQSELEKICKPLGINFSIQNNLIQVTSVDEKFEGTDTLIFNTENSGKIQKKGRDEIVQKATEIIAFSGIDKLTMQTLGKELGLNKASLYHWFSSKDEILEAVFTEGHRALMAKGFRLNLEGDAETVLQRAAAEWTEIFSDEALFPYLRTVFALRYSDERAEEEARALELMIKSQIDVIINALGYQNAFLSSLFTALLLQHLESVLEGNEEDFRKDASSFAALLTSTQDKAHR